MLKRLLLLSLAVLLAGSASTCTKKKDVTSPSGQTSAPNVPDSLALAQRFPALLANGVDQVEVRATVVDSRGKGLSGVGVAFTTSRGSIEPFATTDANGEALAKFTTEAASVDLEATVTAIASKDSTGILGSGQSFLIVSHEPLSGAAIEAGLNRKNNAVAPVVGLSAGYVRDVVQVPMLGVSLRIEASPATIPADGITQSNVVATIVETTSRIPISGQEVRFGASAGLITGHVVTDQTGSALAELTGESSASAADITCYYGQTLTAHTSVNFSPLTLTLAAASPVLTADGVSHTDVVARLVNQEGNPVPGARIDFSTTGGTIISPIQTDAHGEAAATLTAGSTPGTAQIEAHFGAALSRSVSVIFSAPSALTLSLSSASPVLTADGVSSTEVVALLVNQEGNPVPGARIDFSTTNGTIISPVQTNGHGEAVTTLTASMSPGTARIEAHFGTASRSVSVIFATPPTTAELLLKAEPTALPADGSSESVLTATALDDSGNPMPDGTAVTFSVESGDGRIVGPVELTVGGAAQARYIAGTLSGPVSVHVVSGAASASTPIVLAPLTVGGLALSSDRGSVLADGMSEITVTALVTDLFSHPVTPGTVVGFTTSQGVLAGNTPTDATGKATVRLRSNRFVTGIARVTAAAGGFQKTLDLNFVSEEAAHIQELAVEHPRIGVLGASDRETSTITFEVQDRNGIPVDSDHAITLAFSVVPASGETDATLHPATALSNEHGQADVTVNSGIIAGAIEVLASSGSIISKPIPVAIHGDLPDADHFSLFFTKVNVAGLCGHEIEYGVCGKVGDQYSNPVPDSTAVYFQSRYGIIQGSALTDNLGRACLIAQTVAPWPPIPGGDGLVETCAQTVSKSGHFITACGDIMWSGPTIVEVTDPAAGFTVPNGGAVAITYRVHDANNNPLTEGTAISVTTTGGNLGGDTNVTLPDTQNRAYTTFVVVLSDADATTDTPTSVTVTIKVTSDNGNRSTRITGVVR